MSRYYLHIRCESEFIEDDEGAEFVNLEDARLEAVRSIRSLASGDIQDGFLDMDQRIEIMGSDGGQLATVSFSDAITVRPASS